VIYSAADQRLQKTGESACILKFVFLKYPSSPRSNHTTIESFHLLWERILHSPVAGNTNITNISSAYSSPIEEE